MALWRFYGVLVHPFTALPSDLHTSHHHVPSDPALIVSRTGIPNNGTGGRDDSQIETSLCESSKTSSLGCSLQSAASLTHLCALEERAGHALAPWRKLWASPAYCLSHHGFEGDTFTAYR
jgi:hypothetical protein